MRSTLSGKGQSNLMRLPRNFSKDIGDAYFLAGYLPRDYSKTEVEQMLEILENFTGD